MRTRLLLASAAALALAGTLAAQGVETIAPGNNWVLDASDCTVHAEWDGDVSVVISPHDDHFDLGAYDKRWRVADGKIVRLAYAAGDGPASEHDALGRHDAEWTGYVADVSAAFLDGIAAADALTIRRGKEVLLDTDMAGMPLALKEQRACLTDPERAASNAMDAAADTDAAEATDGNAM